MVVFRVAVLIELAFATSSVRNLLGWRVADAMAGGRFRGGAGEVDATDSLKARARRDPRPRVAGTGVLAVPIARRWSSSRGPDDWPKPPRPRAYEARAPLRAARPQPLPRERCLLVTGGIAWEVTRSVREAEPAVFVGMAFTAVAALWPSKVRHGPPRDALDVGAPASPRASSFTLRGCRRPGRVADPRDPPGWRLDDRLRDRRQ